MDKEKIKSLLPKSANSDMDVRVCCKMVEKFSPELKKAFEEFLETGELPDFEYAGWTIEKVMKHTYYDVFWSFKTMDDLMRDEDFLDSFPRIQFGRK